MPDSLKDHLSFSNLIKLLLAPVLVSFAVWISLVFMSIFTDSVWIWTVNSDAYLQDEKKTSEFYENFNRITGVQMSWSDMDILWFIKVKLDTTMLNISWILTMFFGIWISWFLLFRAIKQTTIWESIWSKLQGLWETFLSTTPIIPVGKYWLSWRGLQEAPEQMFNEMTGDMKSKDRARLESLLDIWKKNFDKQSKTFIEQSSTSFNDAFRISTADYWKTDKMIERLDALYGNEKWNWNNRESEITGVYSTMIEQAESKESLEQIVKHLNNNAKDKVKLNDAKSKKISGYSVMRWEDWNYVLEGGDKKEDGK